MRHSIIQNIKIRSKNSEPFSGFDFHGFLLILFFFLIHSVCLAQQEAYESPAGTKFLLYKPPGYNIVTTTYPLLLSLHSKGEVGDDLTELTSKNSEQMPCRLIYLNRWPKDLPFIVLTPQLKPDPADPEIQWSAEYIDEVVRYVSANFRVDLSRIYVTGISRGGTGTWTYASAYPEKVAALVPMSGRSDIKQACQIKDIPVWAFHGDGDGVAPASYSIDMVNAIKACQPAGFYNPRLNILHVRNHNGWNEVYNGTSEYGVYKWLLMFKKNDRINKSPYVNAGLDRRIALRSQALHLPGDYFDSDGEITGVQWKQTGGTTLTLSDTNSQFLKIKDLKTGSYEFELLVTDNHGSRNSDKVLLEIVSASMTPSITSLILMNGKTNTEIRKLSEGQIINKTSLNITEINIKAIASIGTGSVRFSVNTDQNTRTLNSPGPYLIKNQTTGPEWKIKNGVYLICATPYSQPYAKGIRGISQCFKVTVTDGVVSQSIASVPENLITSESEGEIGIFPNPAQQGKVFLTFPGNDFTGESKEANLEIVDARGQLIYSKQIFCERNCSILSIDIDKTFTSGVYMVYVTINRKRFSRRLLVW